MQRKKKIILTGGGTAGHILPVLILAKEIKAKADILYIGSSGMESELVPQAGIKFRKIYTGKIRRYCNPISLILNLVDILKSIVGILQALFIILFYWPDAIFAKGGYVSIPVILAGALFGRKIYLHESDIIPGLANRIGAMFCKKIFVTFPESNYYFPKSKLIYSGLPIDEEFFETRKNSDYEVFNFDKGEKTILITGGSQGSVYLNDLVKSNLEKLLAKYQIIHVCGKKNLDSFIDIKKDLGDIADRYQIYGFLKGMPQAIRAADLVVCRSGSNIFEVFAAGKPSILVPLKTSASNHQFFNAKYVSGEGAAIVYQENELTAENFVIKLGDLMEDKDKLEKISLAAKNLVNQDAVEIITNEII